MTGFTVQADIGAGVAKLQKLGTTFDEVRRAVRGVNGDLSQLSGEMREAAQAADMVFQGYVKSGAGAPLRRRLEQRIGWDYAGGKRGSLWDIDPDKLSAQPGVGQAILHGHMRAAGAPMTPVEEAGGAGGAGGAGSGGAAGGFFGGGAGATLWRGLKMGGGLALGALGISSIAGAVGKGVSHAQEYTTDVHNLLRSTGDLERSFEQLDSQVKDSTRGLNVNYIEQTRLMAGFRNLAQITDSGEQAFGARTAVGMAEAYGLDKQHTGSQLAALRLYDTGGKGHEGTRELALLIGEAVSKGGGVPADKILSALHDFVSGNVGGMVHAPNAEAYASWYAAMNASGQPGLKGDQAESLLARINESIKGGGGAGEASRVFMYGALGQRNPFGSRFLQEEGAFGTTGSAFGDKGKDKDKTNLERILERFGNPDATNMRAMDALSNLLGITMHQAQALTNLRGSVPELGDLSRTMKASGVNLEGLNPESLQNISELYSGHGEAVRASFMGRSDVNDRDKSRLNEAMMKGDLGGAATIIGQYGTAPDTGKETLKTLADIHKALTDFGQPALTALNSIVVNTTSTWSGIKDWWKTNIPEPAAPDHKRESHFGVGPLGLTYGEDFDDHSGTPLPSGTDSKALAALTMDPESGRLIATTLAGVFADALATITAPMMPGGGTFQTPFLNPEQGPAQPGGQPQWNESRRLGQMPP